VDLIHDDMMPGEIVEQYGFMLADRLSSLGALSSDSQRGPWCYNK
jgi:hypothetical protein